MHFFFNFLVQIIDLEVTLVQIIDLEVTRGVERPERAELLFGILAAGLRSGHQPKQVERVSDSTVWLCSNGPDGGSA